MNPPRVTHEIEIMAPYALEPYGSGPVFRHTEPLGVPSETHPWTSSQGEAFVVEAEKRWEYNGEQERRVRLLLPRGTPSLARRVGHLERH